MSTPFPTRTQGARRRPPLDEAKIVSSALALIRRCGVDGLSMRELARELGVVPMSIYHHIRDKDALLERMVDLAMSAIPMPPPRPEAWVEQMKAYTMASWEALTACPGLSQFALRRAPTESSRKLWRYAISILREAGFDEASAVLGVTTFHAHVFGLLTFERQFSSDRSQRNDKPKRGNARTEVNDAAPGLSSRQWMEFGVDTALKGLRAQLEARMREATA